MEVLGEKKAEIIGNKYSVEIFRQRFYPIISCFVTIYDGNFLLF